MRRHQLRGGFLLRFYPCRDHALKSTFTSILEEERHLAIGTVKWFNAKKDYDFSEPNGGGKDGYVHIAVVEKAAFSNLVEGAKVSYEEVANRGKTSAENLRML